MFLLDTNVTSEVRKGSRPDANASNLFGGVAACIGEFLGILVANGDAEVFQPYIEC